MLRFNIDVLHNEFYLLLFRIKLCAASCKFGGLNNVGCGSTENRLEAEKPIDFQAMLHNALCGWLVKIVVLIDTELNRCNSKRPPRHYGWKAA